MNASHLRLYAALATPVALAVLIAGVSIQRDQRARARAETTLAVEKLAHVARITLGDTPLRAENRATLDAVADQLGAAAQARVTLIASDGSVVGDSRVPLQRLAPLENHATRPELVEALQGRVGVSERHSNTVGRTLLYVAVPVGAGERGAVRLAVPAPGAASGIWAGLLTGGGIALLVCAALAFAVADSARRPLTDVAALIDAIAAGNLDHRLPRGQPPSVEAIGESVRGLADQLRTRLADATAEKERLRAVLDGMAEGVLVVDPDGAIVLANDRLHEFFGGASRLTGRTPLETIRHAELAEIMARAYAAPEPVAGMIQTHRPLHRTLRVHAVRFPADASRPTGTVAVFHDVTELTQLEKMRRDFVANASHELRTPLTAIRGFTETLLGPAELSEDDRRKFLSVIDRHAKRLGHLVGDLLELSSVESGKTPLERAAVDLIPIVEAIVEENRWRFEECGLTATHHAAGPCAALADASAVEQILTNLLNNAIQYTEAGGEIHVELSSDAQRVRVEVRDTGIGIPEQDIRRVFERFYRVDKARSRAAGGTGLGLAIVKHLVQGMGGEITVESQIGRGSSFRFELPRA